MTATVLKAGQQYWIYPTGYRCRACKKETSISPCPYCDSPDYLEQMTDLMKLLAGQPTK